MVLGVVALVGFLPAVLMPRFGWLAVYALMVTVGVAGLELRDPMDSPGSWIGLLVLRFFAVGAAAGVLARAAGLILRWRGFTWAASQTPVALAATAVGGWLYLVLEWQPQQERMPVPASCLAARIPFQIGPIVVVTTPAPNVGVNPLEGRGLSIGRPVIARQICSETSNGATPFEASSVLFMFDGMSPGAAEAVAAFCGTAQEGEWVRAFCAGGGREQLADYPRHLLIGLEDSSTIRSRFRYGRTIANGLAMGVSKLASTSIWSDAAGKDRFDVETYTGGVQHWVTQDPAWQMPDGTRYTMFCADRTCQIILPFREGVVAAYYFNSPEDERGGTARRIHANVLTMLADLVPATAAVPR